MPGLSFIAKVLRIASYLFSVHLILHGSPHEWILAATFVLVFAVVVVFTENGEDDRIIVVYLALEILVSPRPRLRLHKGQHNIKRKVSDHKCSKFYSLLCNFIIKEIELRRFACVRIVGDAGRERAQSFQTHIDTLRGIRHARMCAVCKLLLNAG